MNLIIEWIVNRINTGFEMLKTFINAIVEIISCIAKIKNDKLIIYAPIIGISIAILFLLVIRKK